MSFSSEVKAELAKNISNARHCRIAELSGMMSMVADVWYRNGSLFKLCITTERSIIAKTMASLIKVLFDIRMECSVKRTGSNSRIYRMVLDRSDEIERMLQTLKLSPDFRISQKGVTKVSCQDMTVNRMVVQQQCCKRAFIKGVFMTSGSVSDPKKGYHLEIVCDNEDRAGMIEKIMAELDIESRIIARKKYSVCYIKDGTMIVDVLNIMGAHISLMNMENVRILKDISNNVNRRVNCEAANLNKTVSAAVRQIQDINYVIETRGITYLPDNLRELAELRLEEPDASLKELGEMMNPPIGKSGVNHRLRKISEIADDLRQKSYVKEEKMLEKTVKVAMTEGTEERPVAVLVQIASQYESQIHLVSDDKKINAKSIMGMMSMGFTEGQEITIIADGKDAEAAVNEIADYLTANA